MRRLLPLVLAIATGAALAPVLLAEDSAPDPSVDAVKGISATASARANVRYGPSTNARIVCTLEPGDPVEIIGPAEVADWFVVRFPQKGQAWIDAKNLQAVDGGARWRVMADGTRARDDATLKGAIVAELTKGEVVEDRNSARGNWHAVYIPSAVAYVHRKVLNMPNAQAIAQQQQQAQKADLIWQSAQQDYANLYRKLHEHPEAAIDLDWGPLQQQLEEVTKTHSDAAVRQNARRILDGVTKVAEKGRELREARAKGGTAGAAATGGTTTGGQVAATTTGGQTATGPVHTIDTNEPPLQVPDNGSAPTTAPIKPQPLPTPDAPAGGYSAVGFVSENSDYPKVGAPNLLLDGNSNVVAFLTPKAGGSLNLAEYYWRWVGVSGTQKDVDPTLHGLGKQIPLIEVDAVQLVKK